MVFDLVLVGLSYVTENWWLKWFTCLSDLTTCSPDLLLHIIYDSDSNLYIQYKNNTYNNIYYYILFIVAVFLVCSSIVTLCFAIAQF